MFHLHELCYFCNVVTFMRHTIVMKRFIGFNADFLGSAAAIICAIHCMAFPILLSIGLVTTTGHNHTFDLVFLGSGLIIALYVLIKDYRTKHRSAKPIIIAFVGFISLYIGVQSHGSLFWLSVIGGVMITFAHYTNWKLSSCP